MGFGGAEESQEALSQVGVRGVAEDGGGVGGGDLDLERGLDDLQAAVGGEDIGAVDEAGVGFTEFQLGGDLADVGFERNRVIEDRFEKSGLAGGLGVEGEHLAGVGAGGDGFGGHDDTAIGLGEVVEASDLGKVGGGDGEDELVGGDDGGGCEEEVGAVEGVEVVGVGGDDEVGAGAGFDLEAQDLGAGDVGDDLDVGGDLLEGVGGLGEGFAEGGGGEDVELVGGGRVASGEESGEEDEREDGGMGGLARNKSFF